MKEVTKDMWAPSHGELVKPSQEFINWIDSINKGFKTRKKYEPFDLYCQQAMNWMNDDHDIESMSDSKIGDYVKREIIKYRDSSLYFNNRQLYLKEGDIGAGIVKYYGWEAQKILLYCFDCGYSMFVGKGRQIGFSATMGGAALNRIAYRKNYFIKFITHEKEKGEEIFDDKIKFAYEELREEFKPSPGNYRGTIIRLFIEEAKASKAGTGSKIQVGAPKVDAINGGAPNLVLVDEVGLISIFGKMMNEARPTMFWSNPDTGKLEMKRQLIAWGTGGEMDKAGAVFQSEWNSAKQAWMDKDFGYGLIPLFFDFWARKGMTQEIYDQQKKVYYSKTGPDAESSKVQFHQHYPVSEEDMFLSSARTVLSIEAINKNISRINQLKPEDAPRYGYFEAQYNAQNKEKVISSNFIPTEGLEDPRTTTILFRKPEEGWRNRYYQGTDPIASESGSSKMASAIWDAQMNTVAAVINCRFKQFKDCYEQVLLLSLYYNPTYATRELVENNIGAMHIDYKEMQGYGMSLIANLMLPPYLQTASRGLGISNTPGSAKHIINKLLEMIDSYVDNIYIREFFIQLKHFVEKPLPSFKDSGKTRYQAQDLRYYNDDIIYAITFAYIARECYSHLEPKEQDERKKEEAVKKLVYDENFNLRLAQVKGSRVLRYIDN